MRSGLLLTAATSVAVPGLLAVLGVVTQGHGSMSAAQAGPFPVAPASARAAVRKDVAGMPQAAGRPVTILRRLTPRQQALGLKLLARAAVVGRALSYQGTERLAESGVGGSATVVSRIWHQGGGLTVVQTVSSPGPGSPSDTSSNAPEGVFGVTPELLTLLGRHYVAAYRGTGSAAGRPAAVVELYRFDGSLAARYWLDRQTMLPLRRELWAAANQVISEDAFVQVHVGSQAGRPAAVATASSWVAVASPARYLAALAARGWRLPAALAGGLPLYAAAWTGAGQATVADLEYSDGLYAVSLFVQPGQLTPDLPGWTQVELGGQQVYVCGHSVIWAGPGVVYTMIADAPPATVRQAVAALPARRPPGLLARLGRGLQRLARLADPLG